MAHSPSCWVSWPPCARKKRKKKQRATNVIVLWSPLKLISIHPLPGLSLASPIHFKPSYSKRRKQNSTGRTGASTTYCIQYSWNNVIRNAQERSRSHSLIFDDFGEAGGSQKCYVDIQEHQRFAGSTQDNWILCEGCIFNQTIHPIWKTQQPDDHPRTTYRIQRVPQKNLQASIIKRLSKLSTLHLPNCRRQGATNSTVHSTTLVPKDPVSAAHKRRYTANP